MIERNLLLALIAVAILGGVYIAGRQGAGGRLKPALTAATQQADSNAAGAAINDQRAAHTAGARATAEEAKDALESEDDYDRDLSVWGAGLDGVRAQGHAPVAAADGR